LERRLAAIMAVDMVGYSRLVAADETGTIKRHKAHRRDLIDPAVARHGGRIVKSTGDGFLAAFESAVGVVQCAAAIQRAISEREMPEPDDRRISYRIAL
jgi:class 3 adenylate cyclase